MLTETQIPIPARKNIPATTLFGKIARNKPNQLGDRPVMILVPGGPGGNHTVYLPLVSKLLPYADLILFDPRACGRSELDDEKHCRIEDYIEDIEAIRQHFDVKKIILLGGSYGSMASLGYAIKYQHHLDKLILLAGAPSYKFLETAKENLDKKGTKQQIKVAQKLWNGSFNSAQEFSQFYSIMAPLYSTKPKDTPPTTSSGVPYNIKVTNLGFNDFLRTFNYENELQNITHPTLIIWGEDDWINDVRYAELIASKIRNPTLHILKDCGHFAEEDQPELFFEAINDFFKSN